MIFNMTGGGSGSGATLVVSCPANVTVTVSKDDKSYTKNSGNLGSATFKGLATGEWTVTIEGNEQTATKNITITADYAITMAFFAAYINITYPANSTCTVKSSGGTTVASDSNTGSSTKTWKATVITTGTYTVIATATDGSGKSKSTTVSITADGQSVSVALKYRTLLFGNGTKYVEFTGYGNYIDSGSTLDVGGYGTAQLDGWIRTKYWVDFTNYKKLYAEATYVNNGNLWLGVSDKESVSYESDFISLTTLGAVGEAALDVSSITGNHFVYISFFGAGVARVSEISLD